MTPTSEHEQLWFLDGLVTVRVEAGDESGVSVLEQVARKGQSPPLHVHRVEDEVFHVLDGQLLLHVDGRDLIAGPGDVVMAPRGVPHTYRVESDRCHWLVITAGTSFERFVRAVSRPAERPGLPPQEPMTPEAAETLGRVAAEHGIDLVGAPLPAPA